VIELRKKEKLIGGGGTGGDVRNVLLSCKDPKEKKYGEWRA